MNSKKLTDLYDDISFTYSSFDNKENKCHNNYFTPLSNCNSITQITMKDKDDSLISDKDSVLLSDEPLYKVELRKLRDHMNMQTSYLKQSAIGRLGCRLFDPDITLTL